MRHIKKSMLSILCAVLIAAAALFSVGCESDKNGDTGTESPVGTLASVVTTETPADTSDSGLTSELTDTGKTGDITVLGQGEKKFFFTVADQDGNETDFEIHTDKTTVGDALVEVDLVKGDQSEYGLYVKEVNGIAADYENDGVYWAFYINGEYASTGVDSTEITEGATYSFKIQK